MDAAADRPEFAPPPPPGLLRGFALAVLAHLLLLVALTQGLQWQRESENVAVEAELWSAVPKAAAPREEPPAPPAPKPVVKAPPLPDPQVQRDAEIALERERQKREEAEKQKREEAEQRQRAEAEKRKQAQLEREREQQARLAAQKKREEEAARRKEEEAKQLAEAKRKEEERERRQREREARIAKQREENLARIQAMAGTGAPDASGSAARSSGPSASWGAKVQARVRPNIVFADRVSGNPMASVEVRTSPDGTIVGTRLVRSSGVKSWDEAVLRALRRTESLPRDVDGRVPSPVTIDFRPKD